VGGKGEGQYFYLEEVFRGAVDLFEALLACIGHCLHDCEVGVWCVALSALGAARSRSRESRVSSWNGEVPGRRARLGT